MYGAILSHIVEPHSGVRVGGERMNFDLGGNATGRLIVRYPRFTTTNPKEDIGLLSQSAGNPVLGT
jgi:hypothetical protein